MSVLIHIINSHIYTQGGSVNTKNMASVCRW